MSAADLHSVLAAALAPLPTAAGGAAVVLATAGPPPAFALLSTANVIVSRNVLHVAVQTHSSVSRNLGGSCSLLVPHAGAAIRVELQRARSRPAGPLTVVSGTITAIVPTIELPWSLELSFRPSGRPGMDLLLAYWEETRAWLEHGARGPGPAPPCSPALSRPSRGKAVRCNAPVANSSTTSLATEVASGGHLS